MKEPESNVGYICRSCVDEQKEEFQKNHSIADVKIKGHVKVAFIEDEDVEHMWVEVSRIEGQRIMGTLDSDPLLIRSLSHGDPVECNFEDVEELYHVNEK